MSGERVLTDEEITEAGMQTDEESGNYGPNGIDTPRPWSGYINRAGYGFIHFHRRSYRVHRRCKECPKLHGSHHPVSESR